MSNRVADINGFVLIKGNPISKVGVYPYAGRDVHKSLPPDELVMVYRPEEELNDPECINSFRLVPWIVDHVMLGKGDGLTPPEQKGIEGVTGEDVYYEAPYLKANLKVFSTNMANEIDENQKIDLSIGYRCLYELRNGVYNGQKYEAIQRQIRGNHLALVNEGRSGPDVSVLDHFKITLDTAEFLKMQPKETEIKDANPAAAPVAPTLDERMGNLEGAVAKLTDAMAKFGQADAPSIPAQPPILDADPAVAKPADASVIPAVAKLADAEPAKPMDTEEEKKAAMDSIYKNVFTEISNKQRLYDQLSSVVGAFDHQTMTLNELASRGIKDLKLAAAKGQEVAVLSSYLRGVETANKASGARVAADSAPDASNANQFFDEIFGSNE